jgi:hypothetical protein
MVFGGESHQACDVAISDFFGAVHAGTVFPLSALERHIEGSDLQSRVVRGLAVLSKGVSQQNRHLLRCLLRGQFLAGRH